MTTATSVAQLRHALVDQLVDTGHLTDPRWIDAFRAVPREDFVNRFVVPTRDGQLHHHDLSNPERAWDSLVAVYSDNSLLTQWDAGGTATSSSTAPSLMALMLEQLEVADGHTVLEVGTGTGYNAALLSHVLGEDAVTTVDIHPDLVAGARRALHSAGYRPHVVVGDGREGFPARAPFDRIIATCGLDRVPPAWIRQVWPGGKILVNLSVALVLLTVDDDGTASGRFGETAAFMMMRDDPTDVAATAGDVLALVTGTGEPERTVPWIHQANSEAVTFLRALALPSLQVVTRHTPEGSELLLADPPAGSWARISNTATGAYLVEHGPRRLYDELATLATQGEQHGQPAPDQYGLTVTDDGRHTLWLRNPDHVITVLSPAQPGASHDVCAP